jgi:ADP-heptose:LPS heptosyltransferase
MTPLFALPGLQWFSLQMGDDRQQICELKTDLVDLGEGIKDFGDTAAIMESMDLIISIDTAVAHLAGALGVPVWVLLKSSPDWRWQLERSDSPWYRSARVFRQQQPGAWEAVIQELKAALPPFIDVLKKNAKVFPK